VFICGLVEDFADEFGDDRVAEVVVPVVVVELHLDAALLAEVVGFAVEPRRVAERFSRPVPVELARRRVQVGRADPERLRNPTF